MGMRFLDDGILIGPNNKKGLEKNSSQYEILWNFFFISCSFYIEENLESYPTTRAHCVVIYYGVNCSNVIRITISHYSVLSWGVINEQPS